MYISDKEALQYSSRVILLLVPFFSSLFLTWSWIIEILLLFAVFIHSRSFGLSLTVKLLAVGYLVSVIPLGTEAFSQIGYTPWAGVLLLLLLDKGYSLGHSMFWGLLLAALMSLIPTIPTAIEASQPDILQKRIEETFQIYEQSGTIQSFEEQGIPRTEIEGYIESAVSLYYKLLPGIAGILGMLELGLAYLVFRFLQRKYYIRVPFSLWRLPWYAVWLAIIGMALYLGGDYLSKNLLIIVGMNIMLISGALAVIQGLSCSSYFIQHPKVPRILFWLVVITAVFFTHYVLIVLLFIGLFDLVFNFRRIPEKSEGVK